MLDATGVQVDCQFNLFLLCRLQYSVPVQHYWVWPGGRHDQVKRAALKQEIGHNPKEGLDKCPGGHHAGFSQGVAVPPSPILPALGFCTACPTGPFWSVLPLPPHTNLSCTGVLG